MQSEHANGLVSDRPQIESAYRLGVLFIHGIGAQTRGQTLTEFGGALYRWMQSRCEASLVHGRSGDIARRREQLEAVEWGVSDLSQIERLPAPPDSTDADDLPVRRVVLRDTQFQDSADSTAPAHSEVAILSITKDERVSAERWLLAESWWANAFAPPTFEDLARWGFGILPWIVGSHFGAQVQRRLSERPSPEPAAAPLSAGWQRAASIWAFNGWLWRLTSAIGGLAFGLLSTVVTIPLLAVTIALGAIPIPGLRSAIFGLQLKLASTLGDCFVLLARPIEADSIVTGVRRDLRWLAAKCDEVVIVAHSQGGAVAHLALRGGIPGKLRLLFTFGSGLRKLEEARQLMRSGSSFALSSVLTSISLVLFLLCCSLLIAAAFNRVEESRASILSILAYAVAAVVVCVAGIRDHLRGIPLAELNRWIVKLKSGALRWIDCYGSADPVPNGQIAPAADDVSWEVCNTSSMFGDHTAYWDNRDEFVTLLYEQIARSRERDPLPDLRVTDQALQHIAQRRRFRVAVGRFIQWAGIAGVVAAMVRTWPGWQGLGLWAWMRGGSWLSSLLGRQPDPLPRFEIDWLALGELLLVAIPYYVLRATWRSWNQSEMQSALRDEANGRSEGIVLTGTWLLLVIVAGLAVGSYPPLWLFLLCFVPSIVFIILGLATEAVSKSRPGATEPAAAQSSDEALSSSVGNLVSAGIGIGMAAALPFALGLSGWDAFVWLTTRLWGGHIGSFRPESISSFAAGVTAVAATAGGWLMSLWWRNRRGSGAAT